VNISEKQLRELLERVWELAECAEHAGVNEPALKEAEINGLIDSVEEEFKE
jgi:hypothetical protein